MLVPPHPGLESQGKHAQAAWVRGKPTVVRPNDFATFQELFFLITKLVPFILIHLKKLSVEKKVGSLNA